MARETLAGSPVVDSIPHRVELEQELGAAGFLVGLPDGARGAPEAVERAEEPSVRLVTPPDVSRAAPPRLSESVESAVISDPEVGVRLDVVACEGTELCPGVEEAGPVGDHTADRGATVLERLRQRIRQCVERRGRFRVEHRLGEAHREVHGLVGHPSTLGPAEPRNRPTGTIEGV